MKTKVGSIFLAIVIVSFLTGKSGGETVESIVALVNDEVITSSELEEALAPVKAKIEEKFKGEAREKEVKKARRVILENIVVNTLILEEAKRQKIGVSEEEAKEGMEKIRKGYGSKEEFTLALEKEGINEEGLKRKIRDELLRMKIVNKEVKEALEPGDLVKERFEEWIRSLEKRAYIEIRVDN